MNVKTRTEYIEGSNGVHLTTRTTEFHDHYARVGFAAPGGAPSHHSIERADVMTRSDELHTVTLMLLCDPNDDGSDVVSLQVPRDQAMALACALIAAAMEVAQ